MSFRSPCNPLLATMLSASLACSGANAQDGDEKKSDKSDAAVGEKFVGEKKVEEKKVEEKKDGEKKDASATHEVTRELLKQELELDGVFEAQQSAEVTLRPEVWQDLSVTEAVAHGRRVEAGETLVKLDMKKIELAIADAAAAHKLAELAAAQAKEDFRLAQESHPIEMAKAERAAQIAAEDLKRFNEIERPMSEKSANFSLESSAQRLEYQMEELRQLEQMYKADEITEETEEIILKRTRNEVEQAKFMFEQAKLRQEETLKITLPRTQEENERATKLAAIEWERTKVTAPIAMRQKELGLLKAAQDLGKAADALKKLTADREAMNIKAPIAGVVYYGRATRGKWSGGAEAAAALQAGGKILPGTVFMTIINPEALIVRTSIGEKQIALVKPGMTARITPTANPDGAVAATLASVSAIPVDIGGIDATATFKLGDASTSAIAGMTCKVKLVPVMKPEALVVPASAVFEDDFEFGKRYVLIAGGDKPERREVKIGQRTDAKVEIVEGLKAGERILTKKPE
jgi:HlyD family secretion protein